MQHCAGINCLAVSKSSASDGCNYLFTGSRDGTLKRWTLAEDAASCSATLESHVDWVLIYLFFCYLVVLILHMYDRSGFWLNVINLNA